MVVNQLKVHHFHKVLVSDVNLHPYDAALEFLLKTGRQPDILHCHDWSTAEVAPAYWNNYHHNGLWKPKVAFTIHNMNYGQAKIGEASFHSQLTTTVSPSYAGEVAGHPVRRRCKLHSRAWSVST